jgi:formate dehydrogenase maturation protein FdhE
MAILTAAQKQLYLDGESGHCPFCNDSDISGGQIQIEGAEAWQYVSCSACHETWTDIFKLVAVETQDELDAATAKARG